MAATRKELLEFNRFADAKLARGEVWSVVDLARQWEESRRYADSVDALRKSHAEAEAGRARPIAEAFSDIRNKMSQSE